jgi:nitrate/nitrite transport system ATP-binding protein
VAFIELRNVSKTFHSGRVRREVLDNINLFVEEGEFLSIVGYTGSGKSTLLAIAAGLLAADRGQVRLAGDPVSKFPAQASIVFQNYSLLPWFSALENVRLAVEGMFPRWSRERQHDHSVRYLEMVGLGQALQKRPGQLSGGMRQRVAIARAFAVEPSVLFLDEPFGALDALTRANLQQELSRLCSEAGRTVTTLMITNNVDEAILLSDRIVPLTRGPRATLGVPVAVRLSNPRSAAQLIRDETAVRIRSHIVESLTGILSATSEVKIPAPALIQPHVAVASVVTKGDS